MVNTQRLTSLAFSLRDGSPSVDPSKFTKMMKQQAVRYSHTRLLPTDTRLSMILELLLSYALILFLIIIVWKKSGNTKIPEGLDPVFNDQF